MAQASENLRARGKPNRVPKTISVRKETKEHLRALKPFESITWDEWLVELADTYEENARGTRKS